MAIASELAAAERRMAEMINRRADAEQREIDADARSQAMADAAAKIDLQARFSDVFSAYAEMAPAPIADESVPSYHKRLLHAAQRKLSPSDERRLPGTNSMVIGDVAKINVNELPRSLRESIDPLIHAAAELQSKTPHVSTLPPAGEFVERHVVDDATGQRSTVFHGRRSFIADMNRPGRLVHRIMNPNTGQVLMGPPFPRVPGR